MNTKKPVDNIQIYRDQVTMEDAMTKIEGTMTKIDKDQDTVIRVTHEQLKLSLLNAQSEGFDIAVNALDLWHTELEKSNDYIRPKLWLIENKKELMR